MKKAKFEVGYLYQLVFKSGEIVDGNFQTERYGTFVFMNGCKSVRVKLEDLKKVVSYKTCKNIQ